MALKTMRDESFFKTDGVWKVLLKIAPPVMLGQLIQALYNIVDSFFIGRISDEALTALSVIAPLQYVIAAIAVGTGVGVNTLMARLYAQNKTDEAKNTAGTGLVLALLSWAGFALVSALFLPLFAAVSINGAEGVALAKTYGYTVCTGSVFIFLESMFTKIHQSRGNMLRPMLAQFVGATVNIVLDPLLIFGFAALPPLGVLGAGLATVIGQACAMLVVMPRAVERPPERKELSEKAKLVYRLGYPTMLLETLYTVYIAVFNVILAGFADEATVVLGLYYKLQTFFFIPVLSLQTCIVPALSYNFSCGEYERCKSITVRSMLVAMAFSLVGTVAFIFFPKGLIGIFTTNEKALLIGAVAFPIIGTSFLSDVPAMIFPAFLQAIGQGKKSSMVVITRHIFCLIPLFFLLSLVGLNYVWIAYPVSETITGLLGLYYYLKKTRAWKKRA